MARTIRPDVKEIKRLMAEKRLAQETFRGKVDPKTLRKALKGELVRLSALQRIADVLEVPTRKIALDIVWGEPPDHIRQEILDEMHLKLSEEAQRRGDEMLSEFTILNALPMAIDDPKRLRAWFNYSLPQRKNEDDVKRKLDVRAFSDPNFLFALLNYQLRQWKNEDDIKRKPNTRWAEVDTKIGTIDNCYIDRAAQKSNENYSILASVFEPLNNSN